jgi:hypothetical protein
MPIDGGGPGELLDLLRRQCDVITRPQALRFLTRRELRGLVVDGGWRACHRGVYAARGEQPDESQSRWIAVLACRGHLAGLSALRLLGLSGHRDRVTHVLVPARLRDTDPPTSVAVHRTSILPEADRTTIDDLPCTTAARSLVDAVQWASDDDHACVLAAACFDQLLVTPGEVRAVLAEMPRAKRRALLTGLVHDLTGGSHGLPEVEFLRLCRRARLPRPKLQVSRRDSSGRLRYLDGYFDEYGLHVEIDGGQHPDPAAWWAELSRQNDQSIKRERVLRFPAWAVRKRSTEVADQVHAGLVAAGWRSR